MKQKPISGIYIILCIVDWMYYLGRSENIKSRWSGHKGALKAGSHDNCYLQNAWIEYGEDNFEFSVIEEVPRELLLEHEQWWLDATRCYVPTIGYNISASASGLRRTTAGKRVVPKMSNQSEMEIRFKVQKTLFDEFRASCGENNKALKIILLDLMRNYVDERKKRKR